MEIGKHLSDYFDSKGVTQVDIASQLGVSKAYVNALFTGRSRFGRKQAELWAEKFGLSKAWLLTGEGEMLNQSYESNVSAYAVPQKAIEEDTVPIRFYEVNPTASISWQAFLSEDAEMVNIIPARGEKIDDSCCLFKIHGDSMSPQIQSGAIVLCQEIMPTQWHSLRDCVAVVAWNHDMEDYVALKRITGNHLLDTPSYIVLSSDNPEYPDKMKVGYAEIHSIFAAKRIISQRIS